jgi:hypothetical protein
MVSRFNGLAGERVIDSSGLVYKLLADTNSFYPIIRKLETWRPATFSDIGCKRARFRESECYGWIYGMLLGAAYSGVDNSLSWKFLSQGRCGWAELCEVCEDAK